MKYNSEGAFFGLVGLFWQVVADLGVIDGAGLVLLAPSSARLHAEELTGLSPQFHIQIDDAEKESIQDLPSARLCTNQLSTAVLAQLH